MTFIKLHALRFSCPRCPAETVVFRSVDATTFARAHRPICPGRGAGSPGALRAAAECTCGHRGAQHGRDGACRRKSGAGAPVCSCEQFEQRMGRRRGRW
ncbi:hypothetical protein [Cellulosimicrobium sp. Marseille-Q4280]|uniref:hypothetical protein n=1 Tax=Cellulosimicrobium sp. Marseille-Q4280 TaxID=2937992 RepID=UPI00203EBE8E|nr:hypothetical protein [Cellulosimicrobium sp. Marseille-Q4280]